MASGPNWNPDRGTYYVQFWDGKWRRKTVSRKPKGWNPGDPPPLKIPSEAKQEFLRLAEVERIAKTRTPHRGAAIQDVEAFLGAHVASYRTATRDSVQKACNHFSAWCKSQKIDRVDRVTIDVCQRWIDHRAATQVPNARCKRTIAATTLKRERIQISRAWSKAIKRKSLLDNPWTATEIPIKVVPKKRGSWTRDQFDLLLRHSRLWLKDLLVIGSNTGIRIGALIQLRWTDIEWSQKDDTHFGHIVVRAENDKAGKGYRVPISPACHDVLARRLGKHAHDFVLAGDLGRPIANRSTVGKAIQRACKRANLRNPDSPNHHMRRTFGRWAVLGDLTGKAVPVYVVSRWLGHSNIKTTLIYLDITEHESASFMVDTI